MFSIAVADSAAKSSSKKPKHNVSKHNVSTVTGGEDYCAAGVARVVMGPVWDAAKAMGLCCGFPVEGEQAVWWFHLQWLVTSW